MERSHFLLTFCANATSPQFHQLFAMASPKPVPPYFLVVDTIPCTWLEQLGEGTGATPIPLSERKPDVYDPFLSLEVAP